MCRLWYCLWLGVVVEPQFGLGDVVGPGGLVCGCLVCGRHGDVCSASVGRPPEVAFALSAVESLFLVDV
jgi:hypothetical protein